MNWIIYAVDYNNRINLYFKKHHFEFQCADGLSSPSALTTPSREVPFNC